jgi:AcrR family transcriptional regulator
MSIANVRYACRMAKRQGKTNAEASATTREALLAAGATAFIEEQAASHPFRGLTIRAVCERAGYSTGAFYAHWTNVTAYYEDLGRLLLGPDEDLFKADFEGLEKVARELSQRNIVEGLLGLGDVDFELLLKNPLWDAMPIVSATWGRSKLQSEAALGYSAIDTTTMEVYGDFLAAHGRAVRAPLTPQLIGSLLQALIEGLGLRAKIDPESTSWPTAEADSLYAIGAACLLAVLTRADDDDDDLFAMIARLMDDGHLLSGHRNAHCAEEDDVEPRRLRNGGV